MKRTIVILDSNFLFVPIQFKVEIPDGIEALLNRRARLLLPRPVYDEIEKVATHGTAEEQKQAKLALELGELWCEIFDVETETGESVDDLIVRLANKLRCLVATNDRDLRKRLRQKDIPVIFLRERSHLAIDGHV